MSKAETTDTTHASDPDWAIGDIEPALAELRASIGIMNHLAASPHTVTPGEWCRMIEVADLALDTLETTWQSAWEQHNATQIAHEAALAEAKAQMAAPGSPADLERAEGLWEMIRGVSALLADRLNERSPPTDRDAELIALAADYAAANAEIRRIEAEPGGAPDGVFTPLDARRFAARHRATELASLTAAGLRAKASIYLGELDLVHGAPSNTIDERDSLEQLANSIVRDALGCGLPPVAVGSEAAPAADAHSGTAQAAETATGDAGPPRVVEPRDGVLLHLAREYAKIHSRILVLNELPSDAEKAMDEVLTRQHALMDIMIATPAKDAPGWRAKAQVLATAIAADVTSPDAEHDLATSLAQDLMEGIAAPR